MLSDVMVSNNMREVEMRTSFDGDAGLRLADLTKNRRKKGFLRQRTADFLHLLLLLGQVPCGLKQVERDFQILPLQEDIPLLP